MVYELPTLTVLNTVLESSPLTMKAFSRIRRGRSKSPEVVVASLKGKQVIRSRICAHNGVIDKKSFSDYLGILKITMTMECT
jgi:hypothetical protein